MIVQPGPKPRTVKMANGVIASAPEDWELLPPGDAALTRRVKAAGEHWVVQEKKGRRTFSRGVWAPSKTIHSIQATLETERSHPSHAKKQAAAKARRDREQEHYVEDFGSAVKRFLNFHPNFHELQNRLTKLVTQHATPVGSGTVARTKRIPIESRAEAAVIAWMRHQTTCYDDMKIPRVKGKRREIRRMLAQRSKQRLESYRQGRAIPTDCPLKQALSKSLDLP